ncbi:MAG: XRE family transcriptional regulator [Candidatus Gottesmanbacteria bacterium GW2011_GWA2_43_14]|uniref:XRE family transcriptional regulator n=1 Tax=Candidatus Gottesmanbacteria bacterium GW2011_GWA2_43_14 TaxID=1618443 RepID=A0A0G1FLR8_9BACT|nr:MAG: XRE family transcriptional regulator [Candidatus Gottesmanbacteria bacterium GW2011_GWA2_43_14]
MRTVGEILKKARLEKRLTLDEVENQIKIRKKYLAALEDNAWVKLPSLPYIKGFLRNYSKFLELKPEEIVAVFRRQYEYDEDDDILPEGISKPLNEPVFRFTPQNITIIIFASFLLLFFIYLSFQLKAYVSPPNLVIDKPQEGEILKNGRIEIVGKTDHDAVVEINNKRIALNDNGGFSSSFTLEEGVNTIVIESISKFGKKKTLTRTVSVDPAD